MAPAQKMVRNLLCWARAIYARGVSVKEEGKPGSQSALRESPQTIGFPFQSLLQDWIALKVKGISIKFKQILINKHYKRVAKYLDKHNMLFQKKHSTNLATIELVTKILHAIDNSEYTIGVFLDLTKAFDKVNHEIKLEHYGIRVIALGWFQNYIINRK